MKKEPEWDLNIFIYIYIFFSSSWSCYNYFSLQGILRALPGSSNKVHRIVEKSKGNIIEGEEQNSFLSWIIPCNRSTPQTIIVVSERCVPGGQTFILFNCCVQRCCYVIFPFWWISSCFQIVWTAWHNILCIIVLLVCLRGD